MSLAGPLSFITEPGINEYRRAAKNTCTSCWGKGVVPHVFDV